MLDFKKIIAKKIITSKPLFYIKGIYFLQVVFKIPVKKLDTILQVWALAQSDYFSKEDWEDVQFIKLKKILCHSYKNIPHWKKVFMENNFNPEEMVSSKDIQKIPITSRLELKKIPIGELLATNIPRSRFSKAFTSGSTGEPLGFFQDSKDIFRRAINNFQEFRYIGFNFKSNYILILGLSTHTDLDSFGPRVTSLQLEDDIKRKNIIYPMIRSMSPGLIISTPSYIERLLFYCKMDNFYFNVDKICYVGEQLSLNLQKKIEAFFGAKIYTTYGSRECSLIGIQCEKGGQHLAPWMNFVEIINNEIIVTTFENEVMPFVRYSIGDTGILLDDVCECGRSSRLIKFNGRTSGLIELLDGSIFHILVLVQYVSERFNEKILKFQFQQDSREQLCMKYVPKYKSDSVFIEEELKKYFYFLFKGRIETVFSCVDYISPNDFGKTSLFIKNIK